MIVAAIGIGLTILLLAANVALAVYIAFFKSYETKTGEIVAIQNNLEMVIEQNRALTAATEDIKARISTEHREWEFKRDVVKEFVAQLPVAERRAIEKCNRELESATKPELRHMFLNTLQESRTTFRDEMETLMVFVMLIDMCFGQDVRKQALKIANNISSISLYHEGVNHDTVRDDVIKLHTEIETLLEHFRQEMFR